MLFDAFLGIYSLFGGYYVKKLFKLHNINLDEENVRFLLAKSFKKN